MDKASVRDVFSKSVFKAIIEDSAFQRLNRIRFLGAIDFVLPHPSNLHTNWNTRYQHTLGVARLALRYAEKTTMHERDHTKLVIAALLHDIGHAPLSHSLEPLFQTRFDLGHHKAGSEVIRGQSPLGRGILDALRSSGIDPEEIISLIEGRHSNDYSHLFASPMNLDTFDGILRSRTYFRSSLQELLPNALVDCLVAFDLRAQAYFDRFWELKQTTYHTLINSNKGVWADALARKYVLEHFSEFKREDYFICENELAKRHPDLFTILMEAKDSIGCSDSETTYTKREFVLNEAHTLKTRTDLNFRYMQTKSKGQIRLPISLMHTSKAQQQYMFDTTCEQ